MQQRVLSVLHSRCLVPPGSGILLGVSGGPDSLCLLDILSRSDNPIIVAHLDHALRPESAEDASFVRRFCECRNIPFVSERLDAAAYSKENGLSIEEGARILRYRFLFRQAEQNHLSAVAVAHTADDQVETILMHFLRGSGISGLKGMGYRTIIPSWGCEIPLVRPLLDCWREEILTYCESNHLHPLIDSSNDSMVYQRNRIRHQLIPELETYNLRLRQGIIHMASTLQEDHQIIRKWLEDAWKQYVTRQGDGYVEFSQPSLRTLSRGEVRNLLRHAAYQIQPEMRDLSYEALDRAADFVYHPRTGKQIDLVDHILLSSEQEHLIMFTGDLTLPGDDYPQVAAEPLQIPIPGVINLRNRWQLSAEWGDPNRVGHYPSKWHALLDYDACAIPLFIRSHQPGERFQPLGLDGASIKVSDLLINEKIPRRWRGEYPFIYSGNLIAWVPGIRLAHPYRCTASTKRVVHLWMSKLEELVLPPQAG